MGSLVILPNFLLFPKLLTLEKKYRLSFNGERPPATSSYLQLLYSYKSFNLELSVSSYQGSPLGNQTATEYSGWFLNTKYTAVQEKEIQLILA